VVGVAATDIASPRVSVVLVALRGGLSPSESWVAAGAMPSQIRQIVPLAYPVGPSLWISMRSPVDPYGSILAPEACSTR
jgi:hypothetical protein